MSPASPAFFSQCIKSRRIFFTELVVKVYQITRGLSSLSFDVDRFQLVALSSVRTTPINKYVDGTPTNPNCGATNHVYPFFHTRKCVPYCLFEILKDANNVAAKELTSKLLERSAIFFEYSRSDTLTVFSNCSVLVCTSFLTVISLSTAASKERMKGFGSKA